VLTEDIDKRNCYLIIDIQQNQISDKIDEQINRAISDFIGDPFVFIHPFEHDNFGVILQEKYLQQNVNEATWFLSRLKSHLEKEIGNKVFLFAGEIKEGLSGLDDIAKNHAENKPLDYKLVTELIEKIEENKPKEIRKQVEKWVAEVQNSGVSIDSVKMFLFQLEKKLESTIHQLAGEENSENELISLIELFEQKKTLLELKQELEVYAIKAGEILCRLSKERFNGDIYKVKRYIDKHYNENLTLKKIASKFYMNPVYLGQLFKKTYGVYFKDYLLEVRIEKAKQILRQTDMRIYEVAEKVGFGSPDYFVTQFEKMEGSTPSKYRQRIIN